MSWLVWCFKGIIDATTWKNDQTLFETNKNISSKLSKILKQEYDKYQNGMLSEDPHIRFYQHSNWLFRERKTLPWIRRDAKWSTFFMDWKKLIPAIKIELDNRLLKWMQFYRTHLWLLIKEVSNSRMSSRIPLGRHFWPKYPIKTKPAPFFFDEIIPLSNNEYHIWNTIKQWVWTGNIISNEVLTNAEWEPLTKPHIHAKENHLPDPLPGVKQALIKFWVEINGNSVAFQWWIDVATPLDKNHRWNFYVHGDGNYFNDSELIDLERNLSEIRRFNWHGIWKLQYRISKNTHGLGFTAHWWVDVELENNAWEIVPFLWGWGYFIDDFLQISATFSKDLRNWSKDISNSSTSPFAWNRAYNIAAQGHFKDWSQFDPSIELKKWFNETRAAIWLHFKPVKKGIIGMSRFDVFWKLGYNFTDNNMSYSIWSHFSLLKPKRAPR